MRIIKAISFQVSLSDGLWGYYVPKNTFGIVTDFAGSPVVKDQYQLSYKVLIECYWRSIIWPFIARMQNAGKRLDELDHTIDLNNKHQCWEAVVGDKAPVSILESNLSTTLIQPNQLN